ncbi:Lrp/AsnC ligand binding domain-containing protein [Colwellia sp. TT2012]|uniref:Lrp/AsnC ligand binding domain-containing protein n=1 Tax=Colwellia sp. TT2012 TaxID=1720342 RepID=UPI0009E6B25F|nr:Lrp/AsnC ligand binding domain-containing protein [Colwellia sp. TT2012]
MQCYYVTGDADFILIVLAKDRQDFDEFMQSLFFNDSNVKYFKTNTSVLVLLFSYGLISIRNYK